MGWCQEFGLQITIGCDHAMVAGRDSCSCPGCGAVCTGRLAGCPLVWDAAAPPPGIGYATPLALGTGPLLERTGATNGKAASRRSDDQVPAAAGYEPDVLAVELVDASEADGDLRQICEDLKLEMRRLSRVVEGMTDTHRKSDREAVLREVDDRFQWLTDELSDRLVTLGNEVVAIKRYLQTRTNGAPE